MKHRLSRRLLLAIALPVFICFLLLVLILFAFEAAWGVVVGVQEQGIRDLVSLGSSSIERLWIQPRNHVVSKLSKSPVLEKRLNKEISFEPLKDEWIVVHRALEDHFFIYYALADGTIELYPDLQLPEDFDPRVRPWYRATLKSAGGPVWSPPYTEIISKETVVSTVIPIQNKDGEFIGVFGTDIKLNGLQEILRQIELPAGSAAFLLDENGRPFVGTEDSFIDRSESLPESNKTLFVEASRPLSNEWRLEVLVPRKALVREFSDVKTPILLSSVVLFLLAALLLAYLVASLVSRTRRLSDYFEEVIEDNPPLRELFSSNDEFSYLNRQFNKVIIAARKSKQEEISRERVYRLLLERAPIGFYRTKKDGSVLFANSTFAELLGYTQQEIMKLSSTEQLYQNAEDRQFFLEELWQKKEIRDARFRFVKKNGQPLWVSMTALIGPGHTAADEFEIEGFIVDVTKDMEEREQLKRLAETDELTGLANRRAFEAAFEHIIRSKGAESRLLSLISFDVDRFKLVNDTYGHDIGDKILQQIASVEKSVLRKGDVFARVGGDEFIILLPGESSETSLVLASRLQKQIASIEPPPPLEQFPTLSIGITSAYSSSCTIQELLKQSDIALYRAKARGRNCIALYS